MKRLTALTTTRGTVDIPDGWKQKQLCEAIAADTLRFMLQVTTGFSI